MPQNKEKIDYKSEMHLQSIIYKDFYSSYPELRIPQAKPKHPKCLLIHNFLNPRSVVEGAKLKACGLTEGFPDLTLFVARKGFHGLVIELKIPNKNTGAIQKPRPEQKEVMKCLQNQSYLVTWCDNHHDAKEIFETYLNPNKKLWLPRIETF